MHVENVDLLCSQLFETCLNGCMERLAAVTRVIHLDRVRIILMLISHGVLGGNNQLLSDAMLLCPFTCELL